MLRIFNRFLHSEEIRPEALTDQQARSFLPKDPDIQWVYDFYRERGSSVVEAMEIATDIWKRRRKG